MIFEKNLFGFDFEKCGLERGFIFLKREGEVWFEAKLCLEGGMWWFEEWVEVLW
jgi:hypothetical protein